MATELTPLETEELQLRLQLDNAQTQGDQALVDELSSALAVGGYGYSQPSPHLRPTAGEYFGGGGFVDSIMIRLGDQGLMDTRPYRTPPVQDTNYQLGTESMRDLGGLLERYVKDPVYGTPTVGGLPYRPDETPSIGGHHVGAIDQMTPELAAQVSGMMAMHGINPQDAGTMLPTESEARADMASRESQMRAIIDNIQSGVGYQEQQAALTPTQAASPSIIPGLTAEEWTGLQGSMEKMLPAILTGVATRGRGLRRLPTAAKVSAPLGAMVPGVLGGETSRLLEGAQTDEEIRRAMSKGEAAVLYETIPEALFFGPMAAIKRPLFAFLASFAGDTLSEAITELGYIADEVVRDGKTYTWEQIKPRLLHAMKMGAYMGGMVGGAMTLPTAVESALNNRTATPEYIAKVLRKSLAQRKDIDPNTIAVLEGAIEQLENPGITPEQFDAIKTALLNKDSAGAFAERRDQPGSLGYDAVFHVDSILASLQERAGNQKVTRAEAKAKALELIGHEVEVHVALKKAIKELNLNEEEINAFYNRMREENAAAIDAWVAVEGNPYAVYRVIDGEEVLVPWEDLNIADQHEQVEEWLANEAKKKTQEGGKFVRFLRKYFKDQAGLDLSTDDATTLLKKLGRKTRGESAPLQPVSRPPEVVPDTSEADLEAARAETDAQFAEAETFMGDIFDTTAEQVGSAGRLAPMYAKRAADMTEAEKLNRNVRNDFAKGPYKAIIGREDEEAIRARIKRLGNLFGPMGQKRGINPGDRATAKEQAQNAIDNVEAFEEFMAPFEAQMKEQPAVSRTKRGRQAKYAEKKGITVDEILSYRDRGKIHPMERKMSYEFANEEINRLEAEGVITPAEAEARRVKLREFQSELQGRMPPGAKRKVTEIAFGIGDYANIEAWEFTEEQTQAMEERADLAKAKERVTGTRRARPTQQQAAEILEADITAEEAAQISMMAGSEMFDHLTTDEARLAFLREKEAMSAEERAALDEFKKDPKAFDEAEFLKRRDYEERESYLDMIVDHDQFRIEQTPAQRKAELKAMKEAQAPIEKRKHIQVEPDFFETLEQPLFTVQGETIPEGYMELTEDGVVEEAEDAGVLYALKETKTRKDKVTKIIQFFFKMVLDPDKTSNEVRKELQAIFRREGKYSVLSEEEVAVLIGFYEDRRGRAWLTWSPTKRTQPKAEPSGDRKDMSQETIDMLLEDDFFGNKTIENGKTTYDFFTVNNLTGLFTPIFPKFNRYRRRLYQLLAEKNVARRAA